MMTHRNVTGRMLRVTLAAASIGAGASGVARGADDNPDFKQMIDRHADAIVTIKFVMKMNLGMMGDQESESEIPGIMVGEKGLVLCANSQLSGPLAMLRRFMPPGMEMSSEPTDIKVIIGADRDELDAKILARDSDLDLAWVKIDNEDDTTFRSVQLAAETPLALGQKLICVRRMGKLFNRAPAVRAGRVCGETDSPRKLYVCNTELATAVGLPVFTAAGQFAGVVVMQMPDEEDAAGSGNPMGMLGSMSSVMEAFSGVVLPAKQVTRATKLVRDTYMKAAETDDGGPGG